MLTANQLPNIAYLPEFPKLETILIDGNPIEKLETIPNLKKLKCVRFINMFGCPITEELAGDFNKEMLIMLFDELPFLASINDTEGGWDPELLEDVRNTKMEREKAALEKLNNPNPEGAEGEGENEAE